MCLVTTGTGTGGELSLKLPAFAVSLGLEGWLVGFNNVTDGIVGRTRCGGFFFVVGEPPRRKDKRQNKGGCLLSSWNLYSTSVFQPSLTALPPPP
jgi:hypothetical protein